MKFNKFLIKPTAEHVVGHVLAMEAIKPQLYDKAILKINNIIGEMRQDYLDNNLNNLPKFLKEISTILTNRFGIPIKLENDGLWRGPWTSTYSLIDDYTGFDHTSDLIKDGIPFFFGSDLKKRFQEASKKFKEHLFRHDIKIDLDRVYITGLPDDYDCIISCTWSGLFQANSDLYAERDEMITGVLLHEVGHVFSRLEYLSRTRRSYLGIEESVQDIVRGKTNAGYEFVVAYRKNINPDFNSDEYKGKNLKTVAIGILKDVKERYQYELSNRTSTSMESIADQFASRFGYGFDTVEYLKKVVRLEHSYLYELPSRLMCFIMFCIPVFMLCLSIVCMSGGAFLGVAIGVVGFLVATLTKFILILKPDREELIYEIPYIRLEKIVLDNIRQLRIYSSSFNHNEKKKIIKGIDNIKIILEQIKKYGGSTRTIKCERIFEFLNSKIKTVGEISEFSENLERMMENSLHVDQYRFK